MKILYLASRYPYPLEKGDKLRAYHHLRELAAAGHEIYLCALTAETVSEADLAALRPFCAQIEIIQLSNWNILRQLPAWFLLRRPLQVGFFYSKKVATKINLLAAKWQPDLVWTQLLRMSEYGRTLGNWRVLDLMDALSANTARWAATAAWYLRPILRREARLLAAYEQEIRHDFQANFIISQQDADLLDSKNDLKNSTTAPLHILPNGVDTDFFDNKLASESAQKYNIVFVGNMGYAPNVQAALYLAQQIMPLVWRVLPAATLLIAGARPHKDVLALGKDARIHISGWLDDIRTAYLSGQVLAAPLFIGSGQQNKILEAMSLALPCISTPLVNNAIHAQTDKEILIATDAASFSAQILALLASPADAKKIGLAARDFVCRHYTWPTSVAEALAAAEKNRFL
jgi:sugar transferase (PEP-CTERM/EpsH1 system associated)